MCDLETLLNPPSDLKRIGDRLAWMRARIDISQKQLADAAKVTQQTISDLENHKILGTTKSAELARAMGISHEWLATGRGDPVYRPFDPEAVESRMLPLLEMVDLGDFLSGNLQVENILTYLGFAPMHGMQSKTAIAMRSTIDRPDLLINTSHYLAIETDEDIWSKFENDLDKSFFVIVQKHEEQAARSLAIERGTKGISGDILGFLLSSGIPGRRSV